MRNPNEVKSVTGGRMIRAREAMHVLRVKPGHGTAPGLGVGGVSLLCPSARRYPTQAPQLTASFSITCHIRILDGSVCISLSLDKSSKLQSIPRPTGVPGWCFLVKKPEFC